MIQLNSSKEDIDDEDVFSSSLPYDHLVYLLSFLNPKDKRSFSHTNRFFRKLMIENGLVEYDLNQEYSLKYYRNSERFRDKIIDGKGKIVKVDLSFNSSFFPFGVDLLSLFGFRTNSDIADLSCLHNIKEVRLEGCGNVVNVEPLADSVTVYLSSCNKVSDVNCLNRVTNLTIKHCDLVNDTSALASVVPNFKFIPKVNIANVVFAFVMPDVAQPQVLPFDAPPPNNNDVHAAEQ